MANEERVTRTWTSVRCPSCEREQALRKMKRLLREGDLGAREALLLSSSVMELEGDPAMDPRTLIALNRSAFLANL